MDNTLPGGGVGPSQPIYIGGNYPSQGPVYGPGGTPSHPIVLPPPGQAVQLPVFPFDPTEKPDNSLPPYASQLPIVPGRRYIVKWLACLGLILVPDHTLPVAPDQGYPDHTLPGSKPGKPDNSLPGEVATPK